MAKLDMIVNADDIPKREFEPVQAGIYTAMITASEIKPTQNGGEMVVLTVEIQDGENTGRKIFERLNLKNSSDTAVKIAYQTLGEIIRAVGKTTIKDTEELHNKRMTIDVVVDPAKPYVDKETGEKKDGFAQNRIKKYSAYGTAQGGQEQAAPNNPAASSGGATTDAGLPPWKRAK